MDNQRIAEAIADELMTYHGSSLVKADRIVMEFKDKKKLDGPGLTRSAVIGRIKEILERRSNG